MALRALIGRIKVVNGLVARLMLKRAAEMMLQHNALSADHRSRTLIRQTRDSARESAFALKDVTKLFKKSSGGASVQRNLKRVIADKYCIFRAWYFTGSEIVQGFDVEGRSRNKPIDNLVIDSEIEV